MCLHPPRGVTHVVQTIPGGMTSVFQPTGTSHCVASRRRLAEVRRTQLDLRPRIQGAEEDEGEAAQEEPEIVD